MTRDNNNNNNEDDDDDDDSTTATTSTTILLRSFLIRSSQFLRLTPDRSLLLHLLLIGYPFHYGMLPMLQHDACQILFTTYCDDNDNDDTKSLQYNFGLHAVVFYELVGVLWLLMRSTAAMVTFHQVLLFTSLLTLGLFYLGGLLLFPWTDYMSSRIVTCYSMACLLSMWTVFIHPTSLSGTVKWSIPANSIFYAAVIQLFIAIRGVQALLESKHLFQVHTALGHYFMFLHAVLLLRIRNFLQVPQLRFICLYQLLVHVVLLFLSAPSTLWSYYLLNTSVMIGYLNGFLWAGRAEGISRILSGEKED